jgi:hypothetical protein
MYSRLADCLATSFILRQLLLSLQASGGAIANRPKNSAGIAGREAASAAFSLQIRYFALEVAFAILQRGSTGAPVCETPPELGL